MGGSRWWPSASSAAGERWLSAVECGQGAARTRRAKAGANGCVELRRPERREARSASRHGRDALDFGRGAGSPRGTPMMDGFEEISSGWWVDSPTRCRWAGCSRRRVRWTPESSVRNCGCSVAALWLPCGSQPDCTGLLLIWNRHLHPGEFIAASRPSGGCVGLASTAHPHPPSRRWPAGPLSICYLLRRSPGSTTRCASCWTGRRSAAPPAAAHSGRQPTRRVWRLRTVQASSRWIPEPDRRDPRLRWSNGCCPPTESRTLVTLYSVCTSATARSSDQPRPTPAIGEAKRAGLDDPEPGS